jgi:RNA recognition motif-containing protein
VKEHFEPCGEITSVRVLTRPDGKSKGTGFVKFAWKSAYNKALELDGSDMMGRPIKVSEAQNKTFENKTGGGFNNDRNGGFNNNNRAPRQNQNFESNANIENPTLFIGGLSYQSTVESIQHHFKGCGNVISARIVSDRETGKVIYM